MAEAELITMIARSNKYEINTHLISLCICTMNRPDELDQCLNSIFQGIEKPDEVIVSDDGDDPAVTKMIAAKYPNVIYQPGPRKGLSFNRNACLRRVMHDHLIFIDDDVCVPPEFIAVARQLIAVSTPQSILTGYEMNHSSALHRQQEVRKVVPHNADFWGIQRLPVSNEYRAIVINATIFPRSLFEQAQFDEHLRYGCDEIDIARHAVALGYKILYQDKLYVDHYPSFVNRDKYKRFVHASRFYTTTKAYWQYERSWFKALVYLIFAPLQLAASGLKRGDLSTVWKAAQATGIACCYLFAQSESQRANQI